MIEGSSSRRHRFGELRIGHLIVTLWIRLMFVVGRMPAKNYLPTKVVSIFGVKPCRKAGS